MYHSGDTVLYDGMVEKLRRFASDVAADPAEFTSLAGETGQPSRVLRCGQRRDSRRQLA